MSRAPETVLSASPEYQIDPSWSDPARQHALAAHFPCFRDTAQRSDPALNGQYPLSTRDPAVARFDPLP